MSNDLLEKLLASKNCRDICPDTVRRVWEDCLKRYRKPKEAEKAAREALHGISGAFMTPQEARQLYYDMHQWYCSPSDTALERMLSRHASTRERLPLSDMGGMYDQIFAITGRPRSVIDLACGINPLYLGAVGIPTVGVDISGLAVDAINVFASNYGIPVSARCADLLHPGAIPGDHFDLCLLFKLLPLLERQQDGAAQEVMDAVNAHFLAVSFPTRTMGGRNVGMAGQYTRWMEAHMPDHRTLAGRFETDNELFFVLA